MKRLILAFTFAALGPFVLAQTKQPTKNGKPDTIKTTAKSGSGCCSPGSKAKAMLQGKSGTTSKRIM